MPSLLHTLSERRIAKVAALYAGASWGFVQFVSFLEERYMFSPHWTDLSLLGLVLLFPSVLLFTYHHGRPGKDRWVRSEKIGIPANLLITALVLALVFSDKDLGAMTTAVTVTDETGQRVERVVAKAGFRKRIALFNFDAPVGDTVAWLGYGVPAALEVDLQQDIFLDVRSYHSLRQKLREAGHVAGAGVPLSLQRKVAQELHLDHFLAGRASRGSEGFRIEVSLYETRRGRLVQLRTYVGHDVFALIDELSLQLRRDLGVPEKHLEEVEDLPVSSLLTASLPGFREFSDGIAAHSVRDDWAAAARHFEAAVAGDPGFALANLMLFFVSVNSDQTRAWPSLQAAMDHAYRLPERQQFVVRANFYVMRREPEKALAVVQMWTDLFPDDVQALLVLASLQVQRNELAAAITTYTRALQLDPGRHELLRQIGTVHEMKGDAQAALQYHRRYSDEFPDNAAVHASIGRLHARAGDHEAARASYERALLLEPGNVASHVRLAVLKQDLGDFAGAEAQFAEALAAARTSESRSQVHLALSLYHELHGRTRRAIEHFELYLEELRQSAAPLTVASERLAALNLYVAGGREDEARRILASLEGAFAAPYDALPALGRVQIALEREDADAALPPLVELEEFIEALGLEILRSKTVAFRARIHELRGEWQQAVQRYEEHLRLAPTEQRYRIQLGRSYRNLGQPRAAEEQLLQALRVYPGDPHAHYEAGLLYGDLGDLARAREHLRTATQAWSSADPEFRQAQQARIRLAEQEQLASHP